MSNVFVSNVEAQINSYLENHRTQGLASTTQNHYRTVLVNQLLPFCREQGIKKLDSGFQEHMEDFVIFMRSRNLSAKSTQHYLTVAKFFLKASGHPIDFTWRIPRPDQQAWDLKHQNRWFSDMDIARCKTYRFPVQHTRNHILVRLLIETGARLDEIATIKRGNVNIQEKQILLDRSKTRPRPVFFSQETAIHFDRYFRESFPDPSQDSFRQIFPTGNRIYKIIVAMLKDLKLKKKGDGRGPHTFRHYTATYLHYTLGMELTAVASLLGDTPETISSRYLHPTAQMLQAKISKAAGWS